MGLDLFKRLQAYPEPLLFLAVAAYGALLVLLEIISFQRAPTDILVKEKLKDRIFGKLWLRLNTTIAAGELETVLPALDAKASGIVLEVGPGSGNQLSRYDLTKITKIYGVEPNTDLHPELLANIKKHGLSDIYTIVPCGIEDVTTLYKYGVFHGTIDTVMSVQVLCGVPRPAQMAKEMYKLLRAGGQMIVYEHVRSEDSVSRFVQKVYNVVWPFAMGNCHLDRRTGRYLLEAGSWLVVELEMPKEEDDWSLFPHVTGRLVKWGVKEQ